tara:strand:+ start:337 stop:534 length:198 start_codon:yes stop_codon:yes gene_type:complete
MKYIITTSMGNKIVRLENGESAVMGKSMTYGSRYVWIIRKDRETFVCGRTMKDCAERFAEKMFNA